MSARHFHRSAGPLTLYYFTISFPLGSKWEVFASRPAKPACRPTIFTSRPDRLLFYYFTISFPLGSRQEVCASRPAKPACRLTFFACRTANPTRPRHPSTSQKFFCISERQSCMSAHIFACRPNVSPFEFGCILCPFRSSAGCIEMGPAV